MAEYINREALLKRLPNDLPYKASVKRVLMQAPTADVVQRSEVEEAVRKAVDATDKVICEAKAEVAREIFAELENFFDSDGLSVFIMRTEFYDLKKKYTEDKP